MSFTPPPGAGSIEIKDEGVTIAASATSLDFTGTGVTATAIGSDVTADIPGGGGSGTVQTVSVASANGLAGTSDGDPTDPILTLSTSVTGILSGNGTAISAASTTGSGAVVLATSPTLDTPVLGVATATSINGLTVTSSTGTLTIANGKTLTASNTLTFTGTDGSSVAFGTGGTVLYTTSVMPLTVGTTTIASGTDTRVLFDNAGVLGEYAVSGSGSVAMTVSPLFTTPTLGVASATSINKVAVTAPATSATLTIADGKTLTASNSLTLAGTDGKTLTVSNSLTLAGTDATVMTFPSTSATVARTDAGQTFTGVQVMTSPDISTSLTSPSATFSLLNVTPTTINFGGAATTLNMAGGSGAAINLGGGANAAELRFLEPSGSGTNYTGFKAPALAGNVMYTLPTADAAVSGYVLSSNAAGTLSWVAASGLAWGASASGTTADGLTLTLSNSSDDAAGALKLVAGNTQSNQPVLANLQLGTSSNVMGMLIQGTGSTTGGAAGTGSNHLTLWGNTANNANKVLSVGNGTSFAETFYVQGTGETHVNANSVAGNDVFSISPTLTSSGHILRVDQPTTSTTGNLLVLTSSSSANFTGVAFNAQLTYTSASTMSNRTNPVFRMNLERRPSGALTVSDNYNHAEFVRTNRSNNASANLTAEGSVGYFQNVATQTAGTLTDTVDVVKIVQDADSTGNPLSFTQNAVTSTHFRRIWKETNAGITIWMSDGTDPNGALSGTAGDVCYNGASNKPAYCTGTTNWTNLV